MAIVNLRNKSYDAIKPKEDNISDVVDEVVSYILKNKSELISQIDTDKSLKKELDKEILEYLKGNKIKVQNINGYKEFIEIVNNHLWGYSVINKYIDDDTVSDISIKGLKDTWIKVEGKRILTDIEFKSIKSIQNLAYAIAVKNKANLSKRDALLICGDTYASKKCNLRIEIGIAPVNSVCPSIVIRKIPKAEYKADFDTLEKRGMLNKDVKEYVKKLFERGSNILIVGHGASGKTSLLNAGIEIIPEDKSKLGIQEIEELSSIKKNWIWRTVVKKVGESEIEFDLQILATSGLLLDIDWFVIGESKGSESMALFDACYTGHKVALTAHAPSSKKGIEKVVMNMKKAKTDYSREDLLKMLSEFDVVIFMEEYKVKEITEITGYDEEKRDLTFNEVFKYEDGNFNRINESCERLKKKLG